MRPLDHYQQSTVQEFSDERPIDPTEVRVKLHTVGICSCEVRRFCRGRRSNRVIREPMLFGNEASGTVVEAGLDVHQLQPGDRVCIEPGVPNANARVVRLGMYNLDAGVRFWATESRTASVQTTVIHPEAFTHKLPPGVSFAEGAMVEPLAVGLHAATKARIKPGDLAVVIGSGCIGLVTAAAALAAGCARVVIVDRNPIRLETAKRSLPSRAIITVNPAMQDLSEVVAELTGNWGADAVFECSGEESSAKGIVELLCPAGVLVFVAIPGTQLMYDVVAAQVREARVEHVFRHAHMYPRALSLLAAGRIEIKQLITKTFSFEDSVEAFDLVAAMPPELVKAQIQLPQ